MNDIIQLQQSNFNKEIKQSVNARDLHGKLEINSKFADWIKNRLQDFQENIDFIVVSKNLETSTGGTIMKEYYITIETAKNICMIERNPIGKQIRNYFIECEKKLQQQNPFLNASRKDLLLMALKQEEEIEKLQIENKNKDNTINEYIAIDNNKTYTDIAKLLHLKPHKFIEKLRLYGYIKSNNIPYQKYIDCKFFIIKKSIANINNETKHFESYLITDHGYRYFNKKVADGFFNDIKL